MTFEVSKLRNFLIVCKVTIANVEFGGLEGRSFRTEEGRRLIWLLNPLKLISDSVAQRKYF